MEFPLASIVLSIRILEAVRGRDGFCGSRFGTVLAMLRHKLWEITIVNFSPWRRSLLAALICVTPLGAAMAQDQREHDDQAPADQHPPGHQPPPSHLPQAQPHPSSAPPVQHPASGAAPQIQHPAPTPGAAALQHPPQNGAAPAFQHPAQNTAPQTPQVQQQRAAQPAAPQQPTAQHGNFPGENFQGGNSQGRGAPGAAPAPSAAFAGHHGGAAPSQFAHGEFYGHDYAHFTPHDQALWHSGAWRHEERDGRYGWWYVVDGIWYFYPEPIYPFPTYVPDVVYIPDVEEFAPPPPAVAPPPPAAASYYYYFCPDTQTYYPYVTSCASPWQPVSPTPPTQ